ncbi:MAG: hypothetical protein ABSA31_01755 [Acidimicrobiales bacterium]
MLAELGETHLHQLRHAGRTIALVDQPSSLQSRIHGALGVEETTRGRATGV